MQLTSTHFKCSQLTATHAAFLKFDFGGVGCSVREIFALNDQSRLADEKNC